jgi:hypothetical protein
VVVARDAVLDVPEEPLDSAREDRPSDVLVMRVANRAMRVELVQARIAAPLVCVDLSPRLDVPLDLR